VAHETNDGGAAAANGRAVNLFEPSPAGAGAGMAAGGEAGGAEGRGMGPAEVLQELLGPLYIDASCLKMGEFDQG
jgi:hypothetical protein